jgi:hypothetical protein
VKILQGNLPGTNAGMTIGPRAIMAKKIALTDALAGGGRAK